MISLGLSLKGQNSGVSQPGDRHFHTSGMTGFFAVQKVQLSMPHFRSITKGLLA